MDAFKLYCRSLIMSLALSLFLSPTLGGSAAADSILDVGPHIDSYSGFTRGYWFQAPTDFTVTGVRVPTDATAFMPQSAEIVRFNSALPAYPLVSNDFTSLGYWRNISGGGFISSNIAVLQGDIIGVLGTRMLANSYGAADHTAQIGGFTVSLSRLGLLNDFLFNGQAYNLFTEAGPIGRVELRLDQAAADAVAAPEPGTLILVLTGILGMAIIRRLATVPRPPRRFYSAMRLTVQALAVFILLAGCHKGKTPQAAVTDPVEEWQISDDFSFATGRSVTAHLRALDPQGRPIRGMGFEVAGPQGDLLVGASDADGVLHGTFFLPAHIEALTVRSRYFGFSVERRVRLRGDRLEIDLSDVFGKLAPPQAMSHAGKASATRQHSDKLYSLLWDPVVWTDGNHSLFQDNVDDSGVDFHVTATGDALKTDPDSYNRGGHNSLNWDLEGGDAAHLSVAFEGNAVDFVSFSLLDLDDPAETARVRGYFNGLLVTPILSPYRPGGVRLDNGLLYGTEAVPDGSNDADVAVLFLSALDSMVVELEGAGGVGVSNIAFAALARSGDSDGDGLQDGLDQFPAQSDKAFVFYAPGEDVTGTLAFEDLWPSQGDFDFNDLVVDYSIEFYSNADNRIVEVVANLFVKHVGAAYRNGFGIELPVAPDLIDRVSGPQLRTGLVQTLANGLEAGHDRAVVIAFDDAAAQLGGRVEIRIGFTRPLDPQELGTAPFNPFIFVDGDRGREVHLADMRPTTRESSDLWGSADDTSRPEQARYYRTSGNLPWAIHVIQNFAVPVERVPIYEGYRHFSTWAQSNGQLYPDWYLDLQGYREKTHLY
jgi:LruC domain-containing protein